MAVFDRGMGADAGGLLPNMEGVILCRHIRTRKRGPGL